MWAISVPPFLIREVNMVETKVWIRLLLLLGISTILGCQDREAAKEFDGAMGRSTQEVLLFAAASTSIALEEINEQFHGEYGIGIRANFAASSMLAQQIDDGAEADVFLSANERWADYLDEKGLVAERRDLLKNRLVVIVPADLGMEVKTPSDLLPDRIQHLALADPEAVPAGIYAKQALTALGLWQRLKGKVVAGADVLSALSFVETGAAEAGIVYATDAAISRHVKVAIELDADLTDPIRYPVVRIKRAAENPAADLFYQHLNSSQAVEVFRKHGFSVLSDATTRNP